jgi:hypothetical protein
MIKLKSLIEGKEKFDIDHIKFARWGGLSPVKQAGYGGTTFHSPPARKGIYAFVWPYIEKFLLGGYEQIGRGKFTYVKDKDGNVIDSDHPSYESESEKHNKYWSVPMDSDPTNPDYQVKKWALATLTKPKIFDYDGEIWHHLQVPGNRILDSKNDWIKTDFDVYREALRKELHNMKSTSPLQRGSTAGWTKDHLEVFIERL